MWRETKPWQERLAEYEAFKKKCTCPVCKKQIKEWTCFRTPTHGMISQGQWYCCKEHWMQDPNSSYFKRFKGKNNEQKNQNLRSGF